MDYKKAVIFGLIWSCSACASAQDGAGATLYTIDAAASDLHWRVYKAGAFSRFGHNHVIAVSDLDGTILIDGDGGAEWGLSFDVADLVVDDPALRSGYGEDFSSEPSEDDIAGTKTNMLSEPVLNGDVYSTIRIAGGAYTGTLDNARVSVVIEMLGRSIPLELPASIDINGDRLTAEGEFSLEHADLGMEPFSVMMGALQVGSRLDFKFRLHANAAD